MKEYVDVEVLKQQDFQDFSNTDVMHAINHCPRADVEPVRQGHWILDAEHFFGDYGECEVYVVASCSECEKKWHNNGIVFNETLYDYNNDDTPNPITDERIQRCKEYCLQEAEKYILTESPFCEKCGAKMDGKETIDDNRIE